MRESDMEDLKASYPVSEDVERLNSTGKENSTAALEPKPRFDDEFFKTLSRIDSEEHSAMTPGVGVRRGNKYGAVRTYSELCQRTFDSKAEARHGEELYLRYKAGEIALLDYQVKFVLCEQPKITVTIDFAYLENDGQTRTFEDVKGVLTRDSRTKYAWLKEKHGIHVNLIR